MTMGSKPVAWSDPKSRPLEPGIYHRQSANKRCNDRAFWDGKNWFGVGVKKGQKMRIYDSPHPDQDRAWKPIPLRVVDELKEGDRFGMLRFMQSIGPDRANRRWLAKFVCDCGNTKAMNVYEVRNGVFASCGCLRGSESRLDKWKNTMANSDSEKSAKRVLAGQNLARSNVGKERESPKVGKSSFNIHAKYFHLVHESGIELKGWNLAELVRTNAALFEKRDIEWHQGNCPAVKRLGYPE